MKDHLLQVKGIRVKYSGLIVIHDVSLAIDVIVLALRNEYDVAVVVSTDTDILPAIEAVRDLTPKRVETATWKGRAPLGKPSKSLWCHILKREDYDSVADDTDYNIV